MSVARPIGSNRVWPISSAGTPRLLRRGALSRASVCTVSPGHCPDWSASWPNRVALRLRCEGREVQLCRADITILEIMLRYRSSPVVEPLLDSVFEGGRHFRRLTESFNARGSALPCFLGISDTFSLAHFESDAPFV